MIDLMPRPLPPHLIREQTRHGKWVYYVRQWHGPRTRLRGQFDTPEFWDEYRAALKGETRPERGKAAARGTLRWAIDLYRTRSAWTNLAAATRRQRENVFRAVVEKAGDEKVASIKQSHIRDGRERRKDHPHAANNFLKAMRGLFKWALEEQLVATDPTKGVPILKGKNDKIGFHAWTEDEVGRYEAFWPRGTRERLALDIFLYTGFRLGDAARLGRQHVRNGVITLRTEKSQGEIEIVIPLLAAR